MKVDSSSRSSSAVAESCLQRNVRLVVGFAKRTADVNRTEQQSIQMISVPESKLTFSLSVSRYILCCKLVTSDSDYIEEARKINGSDTAMKMILNVQIKTESWRIRNKNDVGGDKIIVNSNIIPIAMQHDKENNLHEHLSAHGKFSFRQPHAFCQVLHLPTNGNTSKHVEISRPAFRWGKWW